MNNIQAKKKFGQNFLKDNIIVRKIVEAIPKNKNKLIEIGPGLGDLTNLMVKYKDVRAYEIDTDLIHILSKTFKNELENGKLELIHTDVLDIWRADSTLYDGNYDLVANLPYYIATNIILHALEDNHCEHIMVMVQKEVAQKFCAKVTDKQYNSLAVITQSQKVEARILFDVPPESFEPIPKVMSSILYIKKDRTKQFDKGFNKFLKAAFMQPRKKLSKNLLSAVDKVLLKSIYEELELNDNARPHEVDASLYHQIYNKVIHNERKRN
ncbi:MAG: 16S rRNA (adenine(1518)-N(6)/adenine(1519)-N(6))-dimethyltransferase RsmA [Campylobacterota bacterium]|nr:16S rRNA (adenine(1518)-N(6)/adenine(1519)-N(6))-dimethyltransferase RsmA [Campylobacterota bacterium]